MLDLDSGIDPMWTLYNLTLVDWMPSLVSTKKGQSELG